MSKTILATVAAWVLAFLCQGGLARADIAYDYYPGEVQKVPDFSTLKPEMSGVIADFDPTLDGKTPEVNYSICFHGGLKIDKGGDYVFYTSSDDGSLLWIDDILVVDNDGHHADEERSGRIRLDPGDHKIKVGYYQAPGKAVLVVSMEGPGMAKTRIPKAILSPKAPAVIPKTSVRVNNLNYEYYEGEWNSLPDFDSLAPIRKGGCIGFSLKTIGKTRDVNFAVRFTGWIKVVKEGEYLFSGTSDDGCRLLVDDEVVVENDGDHRAQEQQDRIKLKPGKHKIVLLYYQHGEPKFLKVQFSGPGFKKQEIPEGMLSR